jgi:hypothetical protein
VRDFESRHARVVTLKSEEWKIVLRFRLTPNREVDAFVSAIGRA